MFKIRGKNRKSQTEHCENSFPTSPRNVIPSTPFWTKTLENV